MRKLLLTLLFFAIASAEVASAASPVEFYTSLLRRGIAEVDAGRNADAVTPLRLAAFGLVDSLDQYQTALAYLTVAYDRLGETDRARDAAQRVLLAERVEPRFASLALPAAVRNAFEAAARKLLTSVEAATLTARIPTPREPSTPAPQTSTASTIPAPANGPATRPATPPPAQPQPQPQPSRTPVQTPPQSTQPQPTAAQPQPSRPPAQTPPQSTQPQPTAPQPQPSRTPAQTPQTATPAPAQTRPPAAAQPRTIDVAARIAAGERALAVADLVEARRIYRELLAAQNADRASWIRIAEGLYRARDFANTLVAFERLGPLRAGEEPYRYYLAVALYETGQYARARQELAAALPHIEITPDVQRYRTRIEAAR